MKLFSRFLIFVILIASSSCKKDSQSPKKVNGTILPGVWELRALSGGMVVYNPSAYKPGNGSLWKFTSSNFAQVYKDSVYNSGTYSVDTGAGTDLNTGRKIDQFIFNGQPAESFELINDTLKIYQGAISYDGTIQMYVKIADDTTAISVH